MKSKQSFIFERLRANFMHHEQEGDKSPLSPWLRVATEDEMVTLSELAFIYFTSLHIYSSCKQPIHMVDYNPSKGHCVPLLYYVYVGAFWMATHLQKQYPPPWCKVSA